MDRRTGGCLCGAVRFEAVLGTHEFGACHCKMCQRWAGAALLALTVPEADIAWQGGDAIATFASSDWAERGWCARCGSGLYYRVTAAGPHAGSYEIPVGIFDDPEGLTMTREIFVDRKPDCYDFAGDRERLTEAETLARYGVTTQGA